MVLRLFGKHAKRSYERAIHLYNAGSWEDAVAAFDVALAELHDQTDPYTALARFYRAGAWARLGEQRLAQGRYRDALGLLDAAVAEQPGYPDVHFHKAAAHLRLHELDLACHAAQSALRLNPGFLRAHVLLSLVLRERGDAELANEELERALHLAHEQAQALSSALGCGPQPPCFERLWSLLFEAPQEPSGVEQAEELYAAGRFRESREAFAALVERFPEYADLRLKHALVLFAQRQFDAARAELEVAVDVNPRFADAWALLGAVHLLRGEIAWARVAFGRAKQEGLPSPFTDYGLAVCSFLLGDGASCAALLRHQATQADAPPAARHLQACARGLAGDVAGALELFAKLLEHDVHEDVVLDGVALALEHGDRERARRFLARLPEGPGGPAAALARARVLAGRGELDDALRALGSEQGAAHEQPALELESARLLAAGGQVQLALGRVEVLLERWPGLAGAVELRISLLRAAGRAREAVEVWEKHRDGGAWNLDPSLELQALYAAREAGDAVRAAPIEERLALLAPLGFAARTQRPRRWLQPLLPPEPPAAAAPSPSAADLHPARA
jgi:tetratricopeptide (TPR) repeat protein